MITRCPETCEYRVANGDQLRCNFIGELLQGLDTSTSEVNRETCVACCRSFLPTPEDLNPVVASLLWSRCEIGLAVAPVGADSEITARLIKIRDFAEASLPLVFSDEDDLPADPVRDEGVFGQSVDVLGRGRHNSSASSADAGAMPQESSGLWLGSSAFVY